MRRVWMALVGVLFAAYAAASVPMQNAIDVPDYVERDVHLLGGRNIRRWHNQDDRRQIVEALAARRYQPPFEGLSLAGEDVPLSPHKALESAEIGALIDLKVRELEANPNAPDRERYVHAVLRDPAALYAVEAKRYRFRNPVWTPADAKLPLAERGRPLFSGGEPVDKAAIDTLLRHYVRRVGIEGVGTQIGLSLGTLLLVMMVFSALAAWLHALFFKPLRAAIARRNALLDAGLRQRQANRAAAERLAGDREDGIVAIGRERQKRYDALRQEALAESDKIRRAARVDEQFVMRNAQAELSRAVDETRAALADSIDEMAAEVVERILGRAPEPPTGN